MDHKHKRIRAYEATSAEVHDSRVFIDRLAENTSRDVWGDCAYQSEAIEAVLKAMGYRSHIYKKGKRDKPLSEREKKANTRKSKVRVRVEHVFGSMSNEQGGLYSRVIGGARTAVKIGLMNVVYNMRRFVTLHRASACVN